MGMPMMAPMTYYPPVHQKVYRWKRSHGHRERINLLKRGRRVGWYDVDKAGWRWKKASKKRPPPVRIPVRLVKRIARSL